MSAKFKFKDCAQYKRGSFKKLKKLSIELPLTPYKPHILLLLLFEKKFKKEDKTSVFYRV